MSIATKPSRTETAEMPATRVELKGYCDARLRDIVVAMAEREDIPLSEMIARLVAKAVDRPDLAKVPRKRLGYRIK